MKECWINIYKDFNGKVIQGFCWPSLAEVKCQINLGGRKLLYRIHVRMK